MRTIHKYPLTVEDNQIVELPKDSQVLAIQTQNGNPFMWVLVDTSQELERRAFVTVGTGHEVTGYLSYIGTYQMMGGSLVFHVFESPI